MQIANTAVGWEMYLRSQTSEQSDTDEQVPIITRHQYAKQAHKTGREKPPDDLSEKYVELQTKVCKDFTIMEKAYSLQGLHIEDTILTQTL